VFAALLKENGEGNKVPVVEIPDFDAETVEIMIDFVYSGEIDAELLFQNAPDLLQIAEKFGVEELKEKCERFIGDNHLAVENVCRLLVLACLFNGSYLKARAIEFFNRLV